jgi:hypothetical protein
MKDKSDVNLLGVNTKWISADNDNYVRQHSQHITQEFLDDIKDQRNQSAGRREGNFMRVASIPTSVVEQWMREGFNIMSDKNITGKEIVARLKAESLDAFLTTDKQI